MKKIIITLFVLFLSYSSTSAGLLKIISREEWGADESYTDINSSYWQKIITDRNKKGEETSTKAQESSYARYKEENRARVDYVNKNFADRYAISGKKTSNGDIQLAWAVSYSKKVDAIVIHHTYSEYSNSAEGIKDIYKYHSLSNQWGDIGYNYVIGYDGEIYEGRLGGDYAISSHSVWNNYSTMSIAVMGDYNTRKLKPTQYSSLKKLLEESIYKYDISMDKKIPLHHVCSNCTNGLETEYFNPIAGHKDGGNTSCPGLNLYNEISSLNNQFKREQIALNEKFQKYEINIGKMNEKKLKKIDDKVQNLLSKNISEKINYILRNISQIIENRNIDLGANFQTNDGKYFFSAMF